MKKNKRMVKIINMCADKSFADGALDLSCIKKIIAELGRLPVSARILALKLYLKKLQSMLAEYTLVVESPIGLGGYDISAIEKKCKKYHRIVTTKVSQNQSLLSGIKIRIADLVFDYSLSRKIKFIGETIHG